MSPIADVRRQVKHSERRLLQGESIPPTKQACSIVKPRTRRISNGTADCPVEVGPVCVVEDKNQFLLHHKLPWAGSDMGMAVSVIREPQQFRVQLAQPGRPDPIGQVAGS